MKTRPTIINDRFQIPPRTLLTYSTGFYNARKNSENTRDLLGACPRTNMPVSGYQYVVLFNTFKTLCRRIS